MKKNRMKGRSMRRHSQIVLSLLVAASTLAPVSAFAAPPLSVSMQQDAPALTLTPVGTYATGIFDGGASEIVAYDATSQRLFSVNAAATSVDILDLTDPTVPTLISQIDATEFGASANSVAVHDGLVAVAIEADAADGNGVVAFYDGDG